MPDSLRQVRSSSPPLTSSWTSRHRTFCHKDKLSQDISSHRHFVTRTICHRTFRHIDILSHSHFVTGHFVTDILSHGYIVTQTFGHRKFCHGHIVTRTFRHRTFRHRHLSQEISSQPFLTQTFCHRKFRHKPFHSEISSQTFQFTHGHLSHGHGGHRSLWMGLLFLMCPVLRIFDVQKISPVSQLLAMLMASHAKIHFFNKYNSSRKCLDSVDVKKLVSSLFSDQSFAPLILF